VHLGSQATKPNRPYYYFATTILWFFTERIHALCLFLSPDIGKKKKKVE